MTRPKRVLFIAYAFPPVGGAGVQRTVKFVKYLRQFGWEASVLTVANPSVPVVDERLLAEVPPDVIVRRARTWEPSYQAKARLSDGGTSTGGTRHRVRKVLRGLANAVLQPDPQVLWVPQAIKEGTKLLREIEHHAIIATAPPYTAF